MYFKVSDIVTIKGDEYKELWEITSISNGYINLKGKTKRSLMTVKENEIEKADENTIKLKVKEKLEYVNYLCNNVNHWGRKNMNRNDINQSDKIFELAGSILHIDTDKDYMEQCLKLYTNLNIPSVGFVMEPKEMPLKVTYLLKTYKPNILVITGHDLYEESKDPYDINSYVNSKYYAQTVMMAREYEQNSEKLMIFAGACSSFFEVLILCGANFASSPNRVEIEALDPAIVACHIALTPILTPIDLNTCIEDTISMYDGIGGIQTGGALKNATFKNIRGFSKDKNLYNSYKHCIKTLEEYGENNNGYAKNLCNTTLNIIADNMDWMNDWILNKSVKKENCELYTCRDNASKVSNETKIKIVIDPGHSSIGNINRLNKIENIEKDIEYKINFNISKNLKEILCYEGFEVISTKKNPNEILNINEKSKIVNESCADLIIKLHCNRDYREATSGAMAFADNNINSLKSYDDYADIILNEYCKSIGIKNRGIIENNNFKSIYSSNAPLVLIGMGYLSNEYDRSILTSKSKQLEVAHAIAKGIMRCFD